MKTSRLLKVTCLITAIVVASDAQIKPDTYDTLYTRSSKMILVPRFDTIKQLEQINAKADTIMADLQLIKDQLGIKEELKTDTTKIKPK